MELISHRMLDVKNTLVGSKSNYHSLWEKLWLKYVKYKDAVQTFSTGSISVAEWERTVWKGNCHSKFPLFLFVFLYLDTPENRILNALSLCAKVLIMGAPESCCVQHSQCQLHDGPTAGQSWDNQQWWQHLCDIVFKKRKKFFPQEQRQLQRRVRMCERNNSADTKVSEEGEGGSAPSARAEMSLQLVLKTTVRQAAALQTSKNPYLRYNSVKLTRLHVNTLPADTSYITFRTSVYTKSSFEPLPVQYDANVTVL